MDKIAKSDSQRKRVRTSVKIYEGLMNDPDINALPDDDFRRLMTAAVRGEVNVFSRWIVDDDSGCDAPMFGEDYAQ